MRLASPATEPSGSGIARDHRRRSAGRGCAASDVAQHRASRRSTRGTGPRGRSGAGRAGTPSGRRGRCCAHPRARTGRAAGAPGTCAAPGPPAGRRRARARWAASGPGCVGMLGRTGAAPARTGLRESSGVGIGPALGERVRHVVDGRSVQLELQVVPRRPFAVVLVVELHGLRIAEVPGVVAPAVAEVDPADERDVGGGIGAPRRRRASGGGCRRGGPAGRAAPGRRPRSRPARTTGSSPSPKFIASGCDRQSRPRTCTPRPASSAITSPTAVPGTGELLVGVALPVGEVHPVAGRGSSHSTSCRRAKYSAPSIEHPAVVALGPGGAVTVAAVELGGRVAPLRRGRGTSRRSGTRPKLPGAGERGCARPGAPRPCARPWATTRRRAPPRAGRRAPHRRGRDRRQQRPEQERDHAGQRSVGRAERACSTGRRARDRA